MFVLDSIFNTKTTEPFWFKAIRVIISILLAIALIAYAVIQFREYIIQGDMPGLLITQQKIPYDFPSVRFCLKRKQVPYGDIESTQTLNPIQCKCQTPNQILPCLCFNLQQESRQCQVYKQIGNSYNTLWFTVDGIDTSFEQVTFESSDGSGQNITSLIATFLTIEINEYTFDGELFMKNPKNDSTYQLNAPTMYLTGGQWLLFEYDIAVKAPYTNQFWALIGSYQKRSLNLNIEWYKTDFPDLSQKNNIVVGIKGKSNSTRYEYEKFQSTMMGNIANLGGFYASCAGIFFYLFGNPKLSPWGITQKTIFVCWPCRRSFQRQLANRYVSSAGIPFGEKIIQMPPDSSIESRLQIVETILKDYYIDTYYIDQLKLAKRKYRKKQRDYEEIEQLPTEDDLTLNDQDYESPLPTQRNSLAVNDSGRIYSRSRTSSYNNHNQNRGSSGSRTPTMVQIIVNENDDAINLEANNEGNDGDNLKRQSKYSRRSRSSSLGIDVTNNNRSAPRRYTGNNLLNFDE